MTEVFLPESPAMTWMLKWLLHACPSLLFSKTARKARSAFKCFLWTVRALLLKTLQPCSLFPRRPCISSTCQPSQLPRSTLPSHQAPAAPPRPVPLVHIFLPELHPGGPDGESTAPSNAELALGLAYKTPLHWAREKSASFRSILHSGT